jgi:hypothetical protein
MASPLIETIFLQGSDQVLSQYKIEFPAGLPAGVVTPSDDNILILRLDKEFEIPRAVHYTYDTYYNGLKSPTVSYKDETDKMIKLDFRLDQNWEVYNVLNSWKNLVFDPVNGIPGDKISTRTTIRFTALGGDSASRTRVDKKVIEFRYAQVKSLGLPPFSQESGDPARVDCELIYLYHSGDLTV